MLTFKKEGFIWIAQEISALMVEHCAEVCSDKLNTLLDPDWNKFIALDSAGCLHCLSARNEAGELVGYVIHIVAPSLHYKSLLFAHDDAHFLKKEYRQGWTAVKMLRAAEDMLKEAGVDMVSYHTKNRSDIHKGPVFARLGYKPQETIYTKFL